MIDENAWTIDIKILMRKEPNQRASNDTRMDRYLTVGSFVHLKHSKQQRSKSKYTVGSIICGRLFKCDTEIYISIKIYNTILSAEHDNKRMPRVSNVLVDLEHLL